MSNLRDIRNRTAQARSQVTGQKYLPARVWNAFVWKDWKGYSRWDKKRIIEQGYERNAPFYAAANIIAQTVADLPVHVEYEKRGVSDHTGNHPILGVLERNSSREELIEAMVLYLVVTGEAYANIVTSKSGDRERPLGLITIPSQYVTAVQGDATRPISHFEVQHNRTESFMPEEIIHIYRPDLSNPFKGMSPGVPLAELIDLNNAGITWNKNVALSGGIPPVIATAPGGMDKEDAKEVQDGFQEQSGAQNAHRLKILSGDLTIHDLNTDPHDAEWGNAVLMSMRMILMSLGVSSSLMNDAANKTYNNVKDSRKALYLDACLPIGDRLYKKISLSLRRFYKDNPLIVPDRDKIEALQEDRASMAKWVYEGVDRGIYTRNQARQKLGDAAGTDPMLDEYIVTNTASDKKPDNNENEEEERQTPTNGQVPVNEESTNGRY
jgi:HK97 family phage portal protein